MKFKVFVATMLILIFLALVFNLFKSPGQTILRPAYAQGAVRAGDLIVTTNPKGSMVGLWLLGRRKIEFLGRAFPTWREQSWVPMPEKKLEKGHEK